MSQASPSTTSGLTQKRHNSIAQLPVPRYLEEYQTGRFRLKPTFASEQQIMALEARPGSPELLVKEFTRIQEGLLELRHNVVLLRCNEDPDAFYPVSVLSKSRVRAHVCGLHCCLCRASHRCTKAHGLTSRPPP